MTNTSMIEYLLPGIHAMLFNEVHKTAVDGKERIEKEIVEFAQQKQQELIEEIDSLIKSNLANIALKLSKYYDIHTDRGNLVITIHNKVSP